MGKYNLRVRLGRWPMSDDSVTVEDLNDETLIKVAIEKIKRQHDDLSFSTQVLIWNDLGREHNLIAVYAISDRKLTVL